MQTDAVGKDLYQGLRTVEQSLPTQCYIHPEEFQRDLEAIWYRRWILACRSADLASPLDYRVFTVGTQEVLVLRDDAGVLRAFHNTCRHRGSQLCSAESGKLKARLLTCPYHAWSYSLRGDLVRVPSKSLPDGFLKSDYPLYSVALSEWRGFVFINLDENPSETVEQSFDDGSASLANWPLEDLVSGHVLTKVMNCNWKIFWENFNECLHCPGVHKHLSHLVPIYGRGLMARHDDPDWATNADNDAPQFSGRLRDGAETWSMDGRSHGPQFETLSQAERAAGQTYAANLPSMFIVGHVDYVRTVRLTPLGPEQTGLTAEWLFPRQDIPPAGLENIVSFGRQVLEEDAAACELNQRGLHSRRHKAGVLMPEEYELARFHRWVNEQHASLATSTSARSAR